MLSTKNLLISFAKADRKLAGTIKAISQSVLSYFYANLGTFVGKEHPRVTSVCVAIVRSGLDAEKWRIRYLSLLLAANEGLCLTV